MKKIAILIVVACVCALCLIGIKSECESEYLRVHIRANSNTSIDQRVKYEVKDTVVNALIPYLSECKTKQESIDLINSKLDLIEDIADEVLTQNGFSYRAKASIKNEDFPTRQYEDLVLESGFYDALIVELGSGKGDNWWCVVYPPLCFVNGNTENIVYKSKILEIIKKVLYKG